MGVLIKLIMAVIIGIVMLFSVMLVLIAGSFFIGFIAELLGAKSLAKVMYNVQKAIWLRTKKWFFRYKG